MFHKCPSWFYIGIWRYFGNILVIWLTAKLILSKADRYKKTFCSVTCRTWYQITFSDGRSDIFVSDRYPICVGPTEDLCYLGRYIFQTGGFGHIRQLCRAVHTAKSIHLCICPQPSPCLDAVFERGCGQCQPSSPGSATASTGPRQWWENIGLANGLHKLLTKMDHNTRMQKKRFRYQLRVFRI